MSISLGQVAQATGGRRIGAPDLLLSSVSTDSRRLGPGALFVALKGPNFNGEAFVPEALSVGAAASLVSDEGAASGAPAVVVEDTLSALQALSKWHRGRSEALLIGLTGSAGKTTTKELTAAILERCGPTLWTSGNLNNHIGVPLTLLRLGEDHRYAVVEMGCNHFGEIALLAELAGPEVGLVTNVGAAHLEGLGDLEGVARAKGELFAALPGAGAAVVNLDDPRVAAMETPARRRVGYGVAEGAQVRLLSRRVVGGGQELVIRFAEGGEEARVTLKLLGGHNAHNAVAAAALAWAAGAPVAVIEEALNGATPAPGRLELKAGRGDLLIIDDTYNANPESMEAALAVLVEQAEPGRGLHVILGEMLELGEARASAHERIGRAAALLDIETIAAAGAASAHYLKGVASVEGGRERFFAASKPELAAAILAERARPGDVILVKGSRGARMERAVLALCEEQREGDD